eukprot:TRINITY_DN486_c1_g1_i1.p1 TRINITY_DN486_c1_g1~~TRINITY_DN486_c1_g1_i1.p1  ORF type:complete len:940 (+),score=343.52 TRINITY_DN486_c1_g1_i1:124-2820(+)
MAMKGRRAPPATASSAGSLKTSMLLTLGILVVDAILSFLLSMSIHGWKRLPSWDTLSDFHGDSFDLLLLLSGRWAAFLLALSAGSAALRRSEPSLVQPAAEVSVQEDEPGGERDRLITSASAGRRTSRAEEDEDPQILAEMAKVPFRKRQKLVRQGLFSIAFAVCSACGVYTAIKGVDFHRSPGHTGRAQAALFCILVIALESQIFFVKRLLDAATFDPGVSLPTIHMHPVRLCVTVACHTCDLCTARLSEKAFQCKQCDFDVCFDCLRARNKRTGEGMLRGDKGAREEKAVTVKEYFRWGWRLTLGFRHYVAFAVTALCLNQASRIFLPNFQGKVIDSVIDKDHGRFWYMLKLYGLMSGGTMLFGVVRLACVSIVSRKLAWAVRNRAFNAIIFQDIAYFDGSHTGQLTAIITQNAQAMVSPINTLVNQLLANIILLGGSLVMCVYVSWKLSLLAFTAVGPIIYITGQYARWSRSINRQIWDKLAEANAIATEAFANIRTVRSFSTEDKEQAKYHEATTSALNKGMKDSVASAGTYGMTNFLDLGAMVLILGYGGALAMDSSTSDLTVGELITFQLYVNMMNTAYQALNDVLNSFTRAAGAAQRVLAVLENAPDIDPTQGVAPSSPPDGELQLHDVDFAYQMRPDDKILRGLNLRVPARRTTALVGRSGGGKSTLVHLLMRFYDPKSGYISLDGRPLTEYSLKWYHNNVGVVSQDTQLFAKTIEYNITYGAPDGITKADIELAAKRAYAHEFISSFDEGYQTRVGERGVRLSGGQKQRIAIARAFLRKPRILFLDEATSALDAEAEHMVQRAIDELIETMHGGCTIVMIAHRLSTVKNADQIAVIADGTVKELGTHEELLAKQGDYAALVERQLAGQLDVPGTNGSGKTRGKGKGKGR